ncbi:hypothetical protein [Pedobacter sp. JCM 36344]|uniref:hypothetical protein n=1 Tax=Pedobacter sp. JCM 36344 TaxID=3374280 RepID=UPI00397AF47D
MEIEDHGIIFSDDPQKLDPISVHHYLSTQSYWAQNVPMEVVKSAMKNSLCFGVYKDTAQIGFARWITDKATFAYLGICLPRRTPMAIVIKDSYKDL